MTSSSSKLQDYTRITEAVQSLSAQSDLEAVVKTLAPALLAELAKMKSSSSSPSSSAKTMLTTKPSKGKPSLQSSEASSATTTKVQTGKPSPPTMVRLEGINSSLSHNDVVTAVEHFGKTKSVVLFRTKLQAIVCFEKEEDAKKLKSLKGFDVEGLAINVVKEEETVTNVQMEPPQKKPTMSITTTSTSRTLLLPTPNVPSVSSSPKPSPSGAQTAKTRVEIAEPMEVGRCADGKGERPTTTLINVVREEETVSNVQMKPPQKKPTMSITTTSTSRTLLLPTPNVPSFSCSPKPPPFGAQTATARVATAEPMEVGRCVFGKRKRPPTRVNTKMYAAAAGPTIGEKIEQHLFPHMIPSFDRKFYFSPNFFRLDKEKLLLSGLPPYYDGCYTEYDVANILIPFGLKYNSNNTKNIFVIPQTGMAFIRMPSSVTVFNLLNTIKNTNLVFGWSTLCCRVLRYIDMKPAGFYKRLMEILNSPVVYDGLKIFFIDNVSPRYIRDLRKAMSNIFSLRNYLPLLNKVFIEFETVLHADRFQVWYNTYQMVQFDAGHKLQRLSMPKGVAVSEQQLATADTSLTAGEMLEKNLDLNRIIRLKSKNYLSPKYSQYGLKQMMVTKLPKYGDGCYTEEDIVKLLIPFGFKYTDNSIFVLPQMCMALFRMPTVEHLRSLMLHCQTNRISLKGSELVFDVVASGFTISLLRFYKTVMSLAKFSVQDSGAKTILISKISPSEVNYLKETLKTFVRVRNYLPLINKLFVEFEEAADANRFRAWYNLQKPPLGYKIHGLQTSNWGIPLSPVTAVKPHCKAESTKDSSTVAKVTKPRPATTTSSTAVPLRMTKEMGENHMYHDRRVCFNRQNFIQPKLDFTDDTVFPSLPYAYLFDEGNFCMNDSVTDDKLNDDVKDSEPHGSSSSSRERLERQSSGVPPASEQTTASVSEPSSFSSPLSTETSSSPGQKMLQSGTKSQAKTSNTTSSGEREKEKLTTAPVVEASIETHLEPLGEEAKATEGAVAKSDDKVSGEGSAAKTTDSEKKVETSSEMHPSSQGHREELSQTRSLEVNVDVDVNSPKDQRKNKEEENEDDVDKHTEEEDDVENYLIIDSLDDQTDKQMDDGDRGCSSETNPAVPVEDQTLHEQSYQVLDCVNDEGRACQEDDDEMKMDGSFQVLDSVTEDQAATGQEDSHPVKDDGATVKGLSEEDAGPVVDKSHEKSAVKDAVADFKDMENPAVDVQRKEKQAVAARQADISAASSGQEMQLEHPENQTLEECVEEGEEEKEGWSRTDIKAVSKRRTELVGPEAKRARSEPPCVSADFKLPPFKPNNPLGKEFVVPKSGYFCNLCSVFSPNESTAKDAHCSSQRHCDNLEKHYQKLEQEPS